MEVDGPIIPVRESKSAKTVPRAGNLDETEVEIADVMASNGFFHDRSIPCDEFHKQLANGLLLRIEYPFPGEPVHFERPILNFGTVFRPAFAVEEVLRVFELDRADA